MFMLSESWLTFFGRKIMYGVGKKLVNQITMRAIVAHRITDRQTGVAQQVD
jgi:hypothetical protein